MPHLEKLEALSFMLGEWVVTGVVHLSPVRGEARVRAILDGAWIEYTEVIDGYSDLCLYGVGEDGDLVVHHFTSEGIADVHAVLPREGGGFHWVPSGLGPVVRLVPDEEGFRCEVGRFEAGALDVRLVFRRP
ncbi:MAG TPA: hypothetical protein QGF58_20525 [Myxococcota bacterium]|jgi:hypothetical protein|nr:hypothetical protein [Myxococcota bacterium]